MMSAKDQYRKDLLALEPAAYWDAYFLAGSRLPGPRGNIELAQVAAEMCTAEQVECT